MTNVAVAYIAIHNESSIPKIQLEIENFAKSHGLKLINVFIDRDIHIPIHRREKYNEMLVFIKNNGISNLIFRNPLNIGRSFEELIIEIKKLISENIFIYFSKYEELNSKLEQLRSDANKRKLFVEFLSWFMQLHKYDLIERTRYGIERVKHKGVKLGRKPVELPLSRIRELLSKGLTKKEVWRILCKEGLKISYGRFISKLSSLGEQND
ncbi:MAG: recombinase family protein [Thermoprotei archaeon]